MIADLKPYPEYKESGLAWLGQAPAHWGIHRLKSNLLRNDTGVWGTTFDERGTAVLRSTEQSVDGGWQIVNPARLLLNDTQKAAALVEVGDLVVTKSSGSALHIGKTSLVTQQIADMKCCFSNFMQRLRVSADVVPQFASLLLNSRVGRDQFIYYSTTTTGLGNLNGTILGNCTFSFPPPAEQAAIVRFLDWASGRLERAIRAKLKVIALLNEQKQAIIHRAVTRGLDPFVPLKPSGIPWLGDIPRHWEVLPLGRLMVERNENNDPIKTSDILSLSLHDGVIPYADKRPGGNKAKEDLTAYKLAYPGDIVLNSMNVVVGSVGLSKYFGAVSPVYYMLRPRHSDDLVEYCDAIFQDRSFQSSLFGLGNGIMVIQSKATGKLNTIRMRIPIGKLNRVDVPHPGHEEQVGIVEYLAQAKASFDQVMGKARREVELLQEYRTRLVADVVTGKLDVREAAPRLPDEAPAANIEDDTELSDETEAADEEAAV